jgi:hypothetical protein
VLLVVLALPFVLFTPDHPLAPEHREPFSWRRVGSAYWISPRAYPDFGWAWLTRFLTTLAIAMGTLYLLYFLRDVVHYAQLFPGQTAADGLLILILIYTGCVVVTSIVGGIISDRRDRHRAGGHRGRNRGLADQERQMKAPLSSLNLTCPVFAAPMAGGPTTSALVAAGATLAHLASAV